MPPPLALVLLPPTVDSVGARSRVGGLTTPLRLALTAQSANAGVVCLARGAEQLAATLADPRLTIPVTCAQPPDDAVVVEVAADVVVHRGLLAALRAAVTDGRARSIGDAGEGGARVVARPPRVERPGGPPIPFVFAPAFGFPPIHVRTRRDAQRAVSAMLQSLRKTQDGWTSTYLNRHVSLAITRVLARTPIRPNQLSVAILGVGVASGVVAARGTASSLVVGAALLQAQSVLDGCDGELSRLTFRGSRLGEWLDTIGDDLSNYGFFAGASLGLYRASRWEPYLLVGGIIVVCGVVASGLEYRYLARIGSGDLLRYPLGLGDEGGSPTSIGGRIAAVVRPLFKRDTFVLLTLVAAGIRLLGPMLVVFAVGAMGVLIAVLKAEARMTREGRERSRG